MRTRDVRARLRMMLTHGLAGFGLLMLVLMLGDRASVGLGIDSAVASADPAPSIPVEIDSKARINASQQKLVHHLARRYRVAPEVVQGLVGDSYFVGREMGVDPLLILAVVAVESSFNPIAQSNFGAKGLMQVVPRFHQDKLADHGGENTILQARTNIAVGTQILKEYIRNSGSVESGLQMYAGAVDDGSFTYSQKVLAERDRLHQVLSGSLLVTNI
ncbi:MAG TPA: transglycosylase SLT domain-containing protein [Burkholderiales bacterium]|nr:transglycosylase SLT domain-containing protein [Burkholderiales bacterium]